MAARRKNAGRKKSKFKTIWDRLSRKVKLWRQKGGRMLGLLAEAVLNAFRKGARLPLFVKVVSVYLLTLALVGGIFLWRVNHYRSVNPYFVPPVNLGELEDLLSDREFEIADEDNEPAIVNIEPSDPDPLPQPPQPPAPDVQTAGWPVSEKGNLLQEFGKPVFFGTIYGQHLSYSRGIAVEVIPGAEILAVLGGTAKTIHLGGPYMHFGYEVTIEHAQGLKSVYQTLESVSIQTGTVVEKGQSIGKIKDRSPDLTYLYLEMYKDGKAVDPLVYLH